MRHTTSAILVGLSLLIATAAFAKDPYNTIGDLAGNKVMNTKYVWGESSSEKVDIIWLGGQDLWLAQSSGVTDVQNVYFGSGTFEWIGKYGYTHRIDDYPMDNNGATVSGGIYKGNLQVGKFNLQSVNGAWEPAAGRWAGELAFPGGLSLPIAFHIAEIGQGLWGSGCWSYPARIEFLGHGYQDADAVVCSGPLTKAKTYYFSFFYFDERYQDSWFVSINAFYSVYKSGDLLQSSDVSMFEISGSGQSLLGKMVVSRPDRFGY